jgi:hypothetical protein
MATSRFGDPIIEEGQTSRFGDPIIKESEAGPEAVGPSGTRYTPEQRREYGTISAPPPAGQRFLEEYARPTAQGLGAGAGSVLGAAAAAPTVIGTAPGAVVGGGIGFAIGDEVVDLIEDWMGYREPKPLALELQESAEDIATGLTYELVGHSLIPGALAASKIPGIKQTVGWIGGKFTKKGAERAAGEIIAAMTDKGPLIAKNWEEARALEEAMPGLQFDLGQLTGEPGIIKFVKAGAETSADIAARQAERRVANTEAIRNFINQSKEAGAGTRDITKPLAAQKFSLEEATTIAERNLEQQTSSLQSGVDPMEAGSIIRSELEIGERAAREAASKKFAAVPEQELIVDDVYDELRKIMKPIYAGEGPKKFPGVLKRNIQVLKKSIEDKGVTEVADDVLAKARADIAKKKGIKIKPTTINEPTMSLSDIQGFRSEILEDLRTAKDKGLPASYRNRLAKALDVIDQKLSYGVEGGAKELKEAQKFFREEVIEKYHKGATKGIMRGEESVQDAMVSGKFFRPGPKGQQAASEFKKALGDNEESIRAISNHIDNSLYNIRSDKTGELTQAALNRWLKNHRPALKEYGLENRYDSLVKARAAVDEARINSKIFEKSAASRALNADVNDVVKRAFAGTGSKKEAAKELMGKIKGDPKALAGLQNTMIDEILTEVPLESPKAMRELLTSTKMTEQFRKYDAAIREVFKDTPEKVKAMHQVRRAVKTVEYKMGLPSDDLERSAKVLERLAGNYGHARSTAKSIAADMMKWLARKLGRRANPKDINTFINRAILDPELATTLMYMAKGGKPEKVGKPFMNRLITTGLIIAPKEENE